MISSKIMKMIVAYNRQSMARTRTNKQMANATTSLILYSACTKRRALLLPSAVSR